MKIMRIGVDLAKNVYQVHGVDRKEKPVWRRQLSRGKWLGAIFEKVEPGSEIGMEACAGAHHWARELQARGYTVKLIAPQFVKPYVKSNKSDRNDAEAICEAMSRPTMRFVSVKSVEQQDIQAMHRIREELVGARTAKSNQIRGLVAEYGVVAPQGLAKLRAAIAQWLEDAENGLTDRFRGLLAGVWADLVELDRRVKELDDEIGALAKSHPVAHRLQQLRGVGPITATALVATLGSGEQFTKGRDFSVLGQRLGPARERRPSGSKNIHGLTSCTFAGSCGSESRTGRISELCTQRHSPAPPMSRGRSRSLAGSYFVYYTPCDFTDKALSFPII